MTLADEDIKPLDPGAKPLGKKDAKRLMQHVPAWRIDKDEIERTFRFKGFPEAIDFVNLLADLAEDANHHPEIEIKFNQVEVELSTHKIGGLSLNDFIMAARIDRLFEGRELAETIVLPFDSPATG